LVLFSAGFLKESEAKTTMAREGLSRSPPRRAKTLRDALDPAGAVNRNVVSAIKGAYPRNLTPQAKRIQIFDLTSDR